MEGDLGGRSDEVVWSSRDLLCWGGGAARAGTAGALALAALAGFFLGLTLVLAFAGGALTGYFEAHFSSSDFLKKYLFASSTAQINYIICS